jgi:hypothetical protein
MKQLAAEISALIENSMVELRSIPEQSMQEKPVPNKWSKKEIMGHLVDSAQNNIRRFVVTQYEETPLIVYNQDKWVAASDYQQVETEEILQLWYLLNKQLSIILQHTDESMANRMCRTQELHTLEWLATDYIKHLKHHIHQVLDKEPVAYP